MHTVPLPSVCPSSKTALTQWWCRLASQLILANVDTVWLKPSTAVNGCLPTRSRGIQAVSSDEPSSSESAPRTSWVAPPWLCRGVMKGNWGEKKHQKIEIQHSCCHQKEAGALAVESQPPCVKMILGTSRYGANWTWKSHKSRDKRDLAADRALINMDHLMCRIKARNWCCN